MPAPLTFERIKTVKYIYHYLYWRFWVGLRTKNAHNRARWSYMRARYSVKVQITRQN
jgi:hypothetical protein